MQADGHLALRVFAPFARFHLPSVVEVRADRPTILAANHRSLLDVFCAAATCARAGVSCRFLVQARYFDNKLIGRWLRRIGCIPLSRETREAAFAEALDSLSRHEVIAIMPEGRLVPPEDRIGQTGVARTGLSELALQANAVVCPIAFHNTDLVWPRGKWPRLARRRPTVTLELGAPIELTSQDHQHNVDVVMSQLNKILNRLDTTAES